MTFRESSRLQAKAHAYIPGGAHTYAKGDDQYPEDTPIFIARGQGCHVWDVDGNEFIEYGMGLRAVTLGHAFEPVVAAAFRGMQLGSNFTRPARIEVEYAEELLSNFHNAEMVKFAKNGSDATTAAIKLARAFTGRDLVATCAEHPFFSVDDWFICTTEMNAGIPESVRNLTVSFHYNDAESLKKLFDENPNRIAAVILEPATVQEPVNGFLCAVKKLCEDNGAVFILDEMITGFRWHLSGAQRVYGVNADLSCFGKAIANGFSVAALAGRREIMRLGGLDHNEARVFLLSTTHGAETHALAAAQETLHIYQQCNVVERLYQQGERLRLGVAESIKQHRIADYFQVQGRDCNLTYVTKDTEGRRSQAYRTLFLQQLIQNGILAPSFVVSFSHSDQDIDRTIQAIHQSLGTYAQALEDGVEKHLNGRPVKPVFRRFN